ncbi:MAG TPA: UDP-N-acetylmuramoyl-L-alanine--D-glutamate ligase [Bacteroidota bacterium]|nr:UDP-N-acetylmuramoyl-L-alanine--D-glutamate ligase [Bacteroidota bacterium]
MAQRAVEGKRVSVIGAARSGRAIAALLKRRGATVFVSDKAPADRMQEAVEEFRALSIPAEFGRNSDKILDADLVVVSPGVPSDLPILGAAQARGITVASELEVASWFCRGTIVGITGTNGKTTTTTLTGKLLEDAEIPTAVGGNIGTAFSQIVESVERDTAVVLEVSSFQLDYCIDFRPQVSVLLNITPDHLDRYGHSFDRYGDAKARIFAKQKKGDTLIYNLDDTETTRQVNGKAPQEVRRLPFSVEQHLDQGAWVENGHLIINVDGKRSDVLPVAGIGIPGIHNLANAMAATLAATVMGAPPSSVARTLERFKGVEHRLEFVREIRGVRYINDSKATNVDSVWYALQSFERPIVLILGGRDKGNDYTRLHELVKNRVRAIVAIGESAGKVVKAFAGVRAVDTADNMEDAVDLCMRRAQPGDIVLLSPACASFDWFENYEHRGRVFKKIVTGLE